MTEFAIHQDFRVIAKRPTREIAVAMAKKCHQDNPLLYHEVYEDIEQSDPKMFARWGKWIGVFQLKPGDVVLDDGTILGWDHYHWGSPPKTKRELRQEHFRHIIAEEDGLLSVGGARKGAYYTGKKDIDELLKLAYRKQSALEADRSLDDQPFEVGKALANIFEEKQA